MPRYKIWSRDGGSRKAMCAEDFKSFVLKGKFKCYKNTFCNSIFFYLGERES